MGPPFCKSGHKCSTMTYLYAVKLLHIHSCDEEYYGPACLPTSALGELREDFSEYPLSSSLWSTVTGNNRNLNSRCGRLTGKQEFNTMK